MASNNDVQALLKPTSEHGRNLFPLDNRHVYSQKSGHITPVKTIHYEPGTHLDITAHDFTLTFPMQTAPFLRGRKEFSFYSVYYNAVWSLFNQYQSTRQDPKTSAFGTNPTLQEPRIRLTDLYYSCMLQFFDYIVYEDVIPAWINSLAANDSYIAANIERAVAEARTKYLSEEHRIFSVHFIFNFSLNPDVDNSFDWDITNTYVGDFIPSDNGSSFQRTVAEFAQDVVGHFRVYNWVRKLDMLGYGNLYPFFRSIENAIIAQFEGGMRYDDSMYYINNLLTERMGYLRSISARNWDSDSPIYKMVNLYPICAYNAVFYHFFRNSYYDLGYYNHDYNLDFVSVNTEHGSYNQCGMFDFSLRFLDIEYHQWKKDTFTAVLPDTQFGAVSSISLTGTTSSDVGKWLFGGAPNVGDPIQVSVNNTLQSYKVASESSMTAYHSHDFSSNFDVIALKRAEMLQEYRQQLLRAGNKTSDVFRAIYGKAASSEHEDDIIPRFLDTFGEDIFVDPVQATANTGSDNPNGQLGDIAARGKFRGDSQKIKFNAGGNFGLILVLSYIVPTAEYNSYMLDKHILELTPEDHFIPQFENLGLEPIYTDELNMLIPANSMQVLGYAPRYHHKKSEVDLAHGAFCSWLPSFNSPERNFGFFGDFNNWVSPRTDLQNRVSTSVRDFYINPSVLDNVFVRAAGADQADDQFICNTFFEVNAIKEMSKIGLINFV